MSRVIVIGAGVIGLTCAHELRKGGADVTILDRAEPGTGCSWANMGWIVPSFARPLPAPGLLRTSLQWMLDPGSPLYIKPRLDLALARWLWDFWGRCNERDYTAGLRALAQLAGQTMELLDRMRADDIEFEMHQSGVLFLFLSGVAQGEVLHDLEVMTAYGYPAPRRLDRDEVRQLEPRVGPEVEGGVLIAQECHLRPETLIAALIDRLRQLSVEMRAGVTVTGVRRRGRSIAAATTTMGDVAGDLFLLTAGAWSGTLARRMGVGLPVQAGKGYSITIESPAWQPAHALYLDEARVAWSPYAGTLRVGGTMEFSGLNTTLDRRRLDALRLASAKYLRDWPPGRQETMWAGMRPLTSDGLPILGRMPGCDNLFVATGHGMLGITLAPATAVAMAQLMRTGRTDVDLTSFRPDRFARQAAS